MSLSIRDKQIQNDYLSHRRAEKLLRFKEDPKKTELSVKRFHVFGGHSHEVYKKQSVALLKGQSLDYITNQNLTHDTTLLFHTTGKGVNDLLKMGLLRPQALTSKAIKGLGLYQEKVEARRIKDAIQNWLHWGKQQILTEAQTGIEQLQDLELHLGQRVYPDEERAKQSAEEMIANLDKYIAHQRLSDFYSQKEIEMQGIGHEWTVQSEFYFEHIRALKADYAENIKAARKLKKLIEDHQRKAKWLQVEGNQEILAFLKERIIYTTRRMQGANQMLTNIRGSESFLRGDLNNVVEDVVKLTHEHSQDFHTPLRREHQLRFEDGDKVTVDSDVHTGGGMGDLEELLLGVSVVAGDNSTLEEFRGKLNDKVTNVKWRHWRSFYDFNKPYALPFSWRGACLWLFELLVSPLNVLETAFLGNRAEVVQSWRTRVKEKLKVKDKVSEQAQARTDYYALCARLNRETSVSTKVGLQIHKAFSYLFWEGLWQGLRDGWKHIKRFSDDLRADFADPHEPLEAVIKQLDQELKKIQREDDAVLGCDLVLVQVEFDEDLETKLEAAKKKHPNTPILLRQIRSVPSPDSSHGHPPHYYLWHSNGGTWERRKLTRWKAGAEREEERDISLEHFFRKIPFGKKEMLKKGSRSFAGAINRFYVADKVTVGDLLMGHYVLSPATKSPAEQKMEPVREEKAADGVKPGEMKQEEIIYAHPAISLNPYESHGVLNGAATGYVEFVDLFGHHMFAKHPFTAAASSVACALSFMAFFTPALLAQTFGKGYVKFLQDQGYIWTKDVFSASMAGSFTHFKFIGAIIEGAGNGFGSWLSKSICHVMKEPAQAVTFVTLAWAIGHALVYLINVPGVSETLREHIGDPPQLSEIFGGAKIGIIAYQLLASPHEDQEMLRKVYIDECVTNFIVSEKRRKGKVDPERVEKFRACLEKLMTPDTIQYLRTQTAAAQAQPKTEEENKLALMWRLAMKKGSLSRLSPQLKAKLQYQVSQIAPHGADATAIDKYIDPDRYAPKSTLRSFLGRVISYGPTLLRCIPFSFLAGAKNKSLKSFARPWKELGSMIRDDVTSTVFALLRVVNKTLESLFNRIPRTLADIVVNSVIARALSFRGRHQFTFDAYAVSAKADNKMGRAFKATTVGLMDFMARNNTSPHPEVALQRALDDCALAQVDKEPPKSPTAARQTFSLSPAEHKRGDRAAAGSPGTEKERVTGLQPSLLSRVVFV